MPRTLMPASGLSWVMCFFVTVSASKLSDPLLHRQVYCCVVNRHVENI
jgi:hypothetical protein